MTCLIFSREFRFIQFIHTRRGANNLADSLAKMDVVSFSLMALLVNTFNFVWDEIPYRGSRVLWLLGRVALGTFFCLMYKQGVQIFFCDSFNSGLMPL